MLQGSAELSRSVSSFAKAVARANDEDDPWPRLLRHDAPRALGNTFIACLGATVMDASYLDARRVSLKHAYKCQGMPVKMDACIRNQDPDYSWETLRLALKDAGNTLCSSGLAPPAPPQISPWDPKPTLVPTARQPTLEAEQLRKAHDLTDVHFCYVDDGLSYSRSPRTAALRAPYLSMEAEQYEEDVEDPEAVGETASEPPVSGAAKYCEDCEMWLNGPTQWEDHKIGKKHKKNVKKGGASKPSGTQGKGKPKAQQPATDTSADASTGCTWRAHEENAINTTLAAMYDNAYSMAYHHQAPPPYVYLHGPPPYGYPHHTPYGGHPPYMLPVGDYPQYGPPWPAASYCYGPQPPPPQNKQPSVYQGGAETHGFSYQ